MFGSFLQAQSSRRNKRLTIKKQYYEPFHIPIQKIANQKPIIKKIVLQCQKLRSTFQFIKQEINRQNSRKRAQFSSTMRKNNSQCNFNTLRNNYQLSQSKQNNRRKENKKIKIDLQKLTHCIRKQKNQPNSSTVRNLLRLMSKRNNQQRSQE